MTQEERDEILIGLKSGFEGMEKRQESMEKHQKVTDEILIELKSGFERMEKRQESMEKHQKVTDGILIDIKEELTRVGNTVTRIEYEHGRKLDILFDAVTGHTRRLEEYEERFQKNEKVLDKHSDEIYYLTTRLQA